MEKAKRKYTEKEILSSYKGRCGRDKRVVGTSYCGSCSIEVHRKQLNDPKSWVHSAVQGWLEATNPKLTYEQLQVESRQQVERIENLISKVDLAYENFSTWINMNKGHICMGDTQRQQFNEILQALKDDL